VASRLGSSKPLPVLLSPDTSTVYDFSIVVPTYARPDSLERLLSAIARLDYPADRFEVVVVDDGGPSVLDTAVPASSGRLNLTVVRQANSGPAAARNRGAMQARGRDLVFTDDDCQPDAGWLKEIAEALAGAQGAVCGGRTVGRDGANLPERASQLLMDYLYQCYNPVERTGAFYPTNNITAPRERFWELGGFDETLRFGEDRDFCYRWQSRGYPFVFAPRAVVRHDRDLSLWTLLRLHFRYGGGTYQFRARCKRGGLKSVPLSPPSWYLGLILYGLRREPGWRGAALSVLLAATQAASAAGVLWKWLIRVRQ
jgi:GT2 family glycosyltransferase